MEEFHFGYSIEAENKMEALKQLRGEIPQADEDLEEWLEFVTTRDEYKKLIKDTFEFHKKFKD